MSRHGVAARQVAGEAEPARGAAAMLRSLLRPVPPPSDAAVAVAPATVKKFARDPNRFELKYWVPEEMTSELVRYVSPFVELDEHSRGETPGSISQCNTSLYLDTPTFDFFRAHEDKMPDRFKLRVRAYGEIPHGMAFFEIKRKVNRVILKSRAVLPLQEMTPLLDGSYDELPAMKKPEHRRNLERFLYLMTVYGARPLVLVRCHREAYSNEAEDIRVTIDREICYQPAQGPSMDFDPRGWVPICGEAQHGCRGPYALLELKFPTIAPEWMWNLVHRLQVRRQGFSKYMWSVRTLREQCGNDADLWDALPARS